LTRWAADHEVYVTESLLELPLGGRQRFAAIGVKQFLNRTVDQFGFWKVEAVNLKGFGIEVVRKNSVSVEFESSARFGDSDRQAPTSGEKVDYSDCGSGCRARRLTS